MAINGMIFDNRIPTARSFRTGFQAALTDGILDGCDIEFNSTNATITIGSGYIIIAGGVFKIDGSQTIDVNTPAECIRVYAEFDPNGTSTPTDFNQITFGIQAQSGSTFESALALLPDLRQDDVNMPDSTGKYQAEICILNRDTDRFFRIAKAKPKIKFIDAPAVNVTTNSNGYAALDRPDGIDINTQILSVSILYWSSNTGPFNIIPYANKGTGAPYAYVIATSGTKINGLQVRYYYI